MELNPVAIWLVVLVLGLQVAEFGLRAARALSRRVGRSHPPDQRERFLAMSPLEKIETFKLEQLDDEAQQFFLAAVDLPEEERRRITSLLRLGWNGGRARAAQAATPAPANGSDPAPAPSADAPSAEVVTLPVKANHPKSASPGLASSERR